MTTREKYKKQQLQSKGDVNMENIINDSKNTGVQVVEASEVSNEVIEKVDEVTVETAKETTDVTDKADKVADVAEKADEVTVGEVVEETVETAKETTDVTDKTDEVTVKVERTTRLEKSRMDKTMKFLFKNKDKMKFDLAIQRNEVWNQKQKDGLIDSIIYGYPVPPIMVAESEDGNFWFLDGKQRGTTVIGYISGDWALSKNAKPILGVEVAGKKFSELPEEFQEYIYDETITLVKLKGLSDQERDEMFVRWNSGSVLSKIELTRAKHSALISQINDLSAHEFFANDMALTGAGRNRFQDQEVVMQIAMLLDKGRDGIKGFGSKELDEYVMEMKEKESTLTKVLVTKIKSIATFMNMASSNLDDKQKKKILKKANTPIVFLQAFKVMEEKIKPNIYSDFLVKFLDEEYDKDSVYGQSLQSGVSKRENVVTRINEIELAFGEYLHEISKIMDVKDIYKVKK